MVDPTGLPFAEKARQLAQIKWRWCLAADVGLA